MPVGGVLAYWGVIVLLIVVPGPDWAYVLATGLRERIVAPAVAGIMLGYVLLTAVVAAGIGALVARFELVLTVLTVVGAAYLIWLGVGLLLRPGGIGADATAPRSGLQQVLRGVGVSAFNPKGLLLFLAILPQFADPAAPWPLPVQLMVLGALFVLTCGGFYLALGSAARVVLGTRPRASRVVSRISGGAMVAIGILLLAERLIR